MLPELHTRQERSDWEYVDESARNRWQQLAASTRGIVTPGNLISVIGLLIVSIGMIAFAQNSHVLGLVLIAAGRLADLLDGFVADRTQTKSSIGETLDVTIDKITVALAIVVLLLTADIPSLVLIYTILQNTITGGAGLYAKVRHINMHPERYGKYATALCWTVIGSFLLYKAYEDSALLAFAYVSFVLYVVFGTIAAYQYLSQINQKSEKTGK